MATAYVAYDAAQSEDLREQELLNFLMQEAENARDTALDDERAAGIAAYQGSLYGDEEEGRSQAVTRDVAETIDWMLTGLLGTVMAGGKAVEFETEPTQVPGPDGQPRTVDYGAEATAAVQYHFFRKQKGWRIIHDAAKAGMLEKTGIVRTYAQPQKPLRQVLEVFSADIVMTADGPVYEGLSVVDGEGIDEGWEPGIPSLMQRITVEVPQAPVVRDENTPNEWFRVSPDTVDLDESPYVGSCIPVSISKLVEMGYAYDELKTLWDNAPAESIVEDARDAERSKSRQNVVRRQDSERQLWLYCEYPLYDLNEDGVAERLCVYRIGRTILSITEVDEQPYTGWSPIPMQHRFTGQSLYDKTGDIQRIRTVLLRNALDSIYLGNSPRTLISEDAMTADTIDDLLTVRPGALIRYKGGVAPQPFVSQDMSVTAFNAMEMMSSERDGRTGLTRQSQGMNPDATNKTATGLSLLQENADQLELYVCRNFIEGQVAPMFLKRYRLMKAHMKPFRMKLDGEYVTVDPSQWPDDIDVKINVGLGTGTKDTKVAYLTQLAGAQSNALESGSPIFTQKNLYNTMKSLVEIADIGVTSDFLTDPDTVQPGPPQQDPAVVKAQADAQVRAAKDAQAHEQAMAKLELQRQSQDASAALDAQRNEYDLAAKREKAALDEQLARDKALFEASLATERQNFEMGLAMERAAFDREMAEKKAEQTPEVGGVSALRPGGDLSE